MGYVQHAPIVTRSVSEVSALAYASGYYVVKEGEVIGNLRQCRDAHYGMAFISHDKPPAAGMYDSLT